MLTVDFEKIRLFQWDGAHLTGPVAQLDTEEVLRNYEPEFGRRRMFKSYLVALVEAWLSDLAYHWKLTNPPESEELRRAGFLTRLEGGTTRFIQE